MNKSIITTALCALSMGVMTSCYDLDRYPTDSINAGTMWKTEAHAEAGMMAVYNMLYNNNTTGCNFAFDALGEIGFTYDLLQVQTIARGTYSASSNFIENRWSNLYEGIARANLLLQNIDKVEISSDLIARYKGEAKFMRAFYYFLLLDTYGGVPLYDESRVVGDDFSNMLEPRSTAEQTRTFILQDLEDAIAILPDVWSNTESGGRATLGAAYALKGKVLLFNQQYTEAEKAFEEVRKLKLYDLYDDYADLFTPKGDGSNEMIFAVQNAGDQGYTNGMPMCFYLGTRSSFGSCWNNVMLSTSFVDSYEWKDGRPFDWEEFIPGITTDEALCNEVFRSELSSDNKTVKAYTPYKEKLLEMYEQRDPRMSATAILPYTKYNGWTSNALKECEFVLAKNANGDPLTTTTTTVANGFMQINGNYIIYPFRKFVPEGNMNGDLTNRSYTPINFPIIRYADVLLMLAECYNETGNGDPIALINLVRERAGVDELNSGPAHLAASTKEEIFKRIRHERKVEFAGEGLNFSDMRRWGVLEELHGKQEKPITRGNTVYYTHAVKSRDYLWPIPQSEIDKNDKLEKNKDW